MLSVEDYIRSTKILLDEMLAETRLLQKGVQSLTLNLRFQFLDKLEVLAVRHNAARSLLETLERAPNSRSFEAKMTLDKALAGLRDTMDKAKRSFEAARIVTETPEPKPVRVKADDSPRPEA